jgi:AraC family transcriptional regulator of adaptative response/methylated-DNA-[protein]-cysteine methyltransferase
MNPPQTPCTETWLRQLAGEHSVGALPEGWLYGVRSTGIVCRPGCPSRRPRAANVVLPLTLAEARARGFRPCRRCRPDR